MIIYVKTKSTNKCTKRGGLHTKKIIILVICIITFILLVVGASYAYLSLKATSNDITGVAASTGLTVNVQKSVNGGKLIPMDDDDLSSAISYTTPCIDKNGYGACNLYTVTVTNTGSVPVTVESDVQLVHDEFAAGFEDLVWQEISSLTTTGTITGATNGSSATSFTTNGAVTLDYKELLGDYELEEIDDDVEVIWLTSNSDIYLEYNTDDDYYLYHDEKEYNRIDNSKSENGSTYPYAYIDENENVVYYVDESDYLYDSNENIISDEWYSIYDEDKILSDKNNENLGVYSEAPSFYDSNNNFYIVSYLYDDIYLVSRNSKIKYEGKRVVYFKNVNDDNDVLHFNLNSDSDYTFTLLNSDNESVYTIDISCASEKGFCVRDLENNIIGYYNLDIYTIDGRYLYDAYSELNFVDEDGNIKYTMDLNSYTVVDANGNEMDLLNVKKEYTAKKWRTGDLVAAGETKTYYLAVWISNEDEDQSNTNYGSYDAKVTFRTIQQGDDGIKGEFFETPVSFATDSWEVIAANTTSSVYNVGDTKCVALDGFTTTNDNGCPDGEFKVRIANKSTPEECNSSNYSQTACGFVVEFEDIITEHSMYDETPETSEKWSTTDMKTYLDTVIYSALPEDLRKRIITTSSLTDYYDDTTSTWEIDSSNDKLYLLGWYEVITEHYNGTDYESDYTRKLDIYTQFANGYQTQSYQGGYSVKPLESSNSKSNGVKAVPIMQIDPPKYYSELKYYNGIDFAWWLREDGEYVDSDEAEMLYTTATYSKGVSPAFRLG